MARPREFDEAEVVELARNAFWSHGVAATSITALSDATGLSVGSIYKAFTNKDTLCHMTLADYLQRARDQMAETLTQAPTPWDGLHTWLDSVVDQASDTSPTRGCYAVVVATERAAIDDDVRAQLHDHDRLLRSIVSGAVRSGIEDGRVIGDADAVARLICTTVNGLQVEARKGISRSDAQATIDTMLRALERV